MAALTWSRAVSSLPRPLAHPVGAWISGGRSGRLANQPWANRGPSYCALFRGDPSGKSAMPWLSVGSGGGGGQQASGRRVALGARVGPPLCPGQAGAGLCFLPQNFLGATGGATKSCLLACCDLACAPCACALCSLQCQGQGQGQGPAIPPPPSPTCDR
jgi:hypothetical protein